jgi:hypothetical protein
MIDEGEVTAEGVKALLRNTREATQAAFAFL